MFPDSSRFGTGLFHMLFTPAFRSGHGGVSGNDAGTKTSTFLIPLA